MNSTIVSAIAALPLLIGGTLGSVQNAWFLSGVNGYESEQESSIAPAKFSLFNSTQNQHLNFKLAARGEKDEQCTMYGGRGCSDADDTLAPVQEL